MKDNSDNKRYSYLTLGMSIGGAVGVVLGYINNNTILYLSLGMGIGSALGAIYSGMKEDKDKDKDKK